MIPAAALAVCGSPRQEAVSDRQFCPGPATIARQPATIARQPATPMKIAIWRRCWGTALALSLSRSHEVALWECDPQQARAVQAERENKRTCPVFHFPTPCISVPIARASCVAAKSILSRRRSPGARDPAPASHRMVASSAGMSDPTPLIWVCKGLEAQHAPAAQIVAEELGPDTRCGA